MLLSLNGAADDHDTTPQGAALLDPSQAQLSHLVRIPKFLSSDDIDVLEYAAARHRSSHPDAGFTLYLQHNGLHSTVDLIVQRIHDSVKRIDVEHWGLNAVHELEGVSGIGAIGMDGSSSGSDSSASDVSASYCTDGSMRARTVEFHEYGAGKRQVCASHCDHGSLFTADLMLSRTGDFTGGRFTTTCARDGDVPVDTEHEFERGDMLVFPAHMPHCVRRVTSGSRKVFVVEFWRGPSCTCDMRCVGRCASKSGRQTRARRVKGDNR